MKVEDQLTFYEIDDHMLDMDLQRTSMPNDGIKSVETALIRNANFPC